MSESITILPGEQMDFVNIKFCKVTNEHDKSESYAYCGKKDSRELPSEVFAYDSDDDDIEFPTLLKKEEDGSFKKMGDISTAIQEVEKVSKEETDKKAEDAAEKARLAGEEAEKARLAAEEAEKARLAAEEAEKARLAAEAKEDAATEKAKEEADAAAQNNDEEKTQEPTMQSNPMNTELSNKEKPEKPIKEKQEGGASTRKHRKNRKNKTKRVRFTKKSSIKRGRRQTKRK